MSRPTVALAAALAFASVAGQSLAADGVVGPGNCNEAGFSAVLANVQATGGGTLTFNCGVGPTTVVFTSYKQISSPVVIDGGDSITFDGNNASAFFQIFGSASLHLKRLNLRRGVFSSSHALENFGSLRLDGVGVREGQGSASALVNYGNLIVATSVFSQNQINTGTSRRGAAINNDGGTALIVDSSFNANVVQGGIGTGGAIAASGGSLTVRRGTFAGNNAFDGGAIYVTNGVITRIEQSVFTSNIAGYGGAIETWTADIQVQHSRFEGNRANNGDGGAIWAVDGQLVINWSEFTTNTAATTGGAISCYDDILAVINSAFSGNQSGSHGGAIYSGCGFSVMNGTFNGNTALGASSGGGAIAQSGPSSGTVTFSTMAGNSAGFGGGLYNDGAGSNTLAVGNSMLAGNTGGNCAGVLSSNGYNLSSDTFCGAAFTGTGDGNNATLNLLAFGQYGGPTRTRPPQAGNPAIDRIPAPACGFPFDQRGAGRPVNNACDSGAYEVGGVIDAIFSNGFQF